jgi:AcrR family transcriptional regulator
MSSMDTVTPIGRRMSAAQRRLQLLEVTKAMVGAEGFHAVTIEAVARRAGVSRPVVYEHFGDLRGLLDALIDLLSRTALEQLAAVLPTDLGGGKPRVVLLAALRGYLEVAEADPVTWRLVLMPAEGAPKAARERIAEGRSRVVAQLAAAVAPGFVAGREVPDPELMALMLVTTADELVRLVLTQPSRYPVDRVLAHAGWLLGQFEAGGGS